MSRRVEIGCDVCRDVVRGSNLGGPCNTDREFVAFEFAGEVGEMNAFRMAYPNDCERHICVRCLRGLASLLSAYESGRGKVGERLKAIEGEPPKTEPA